MAIVPSGTRKLMVAQAFGQQPAFNPQLENMNMDKPMSSTDDASGSFLPKGLFDNKEDNDGGSSPDITEYIFKKLESFGYPPRRLEQFENKFVDEKLYPGGIRELSITLPDRYYAKRKRLADKDVASIVKEMQDQFQLNFVDAERKDKNLKMNFTSQTQKDENEEEVMAGDVLDDVYGGGEGPSKQKKNKKASTINELLKHNKEDLFQTMLSILKGK